MKKIFILLFTSLTFIFPTAYYADDTTDSILIRTVDSTEAVRRFNNTLKDNWGMVSRGGFGENSYIGNPFTIEYQYPGYQYPDTVLFNFPIITNNKITSYIEQYDYNNDYASWNRIPWFFGENTEYATNQLKDGNIYSIIVDKNDNILAVSDDNKVIEIFRTSNPIDYDPPYEGIDTVVVDIMAKADNIDTSPIIPQTEEEKAVIENARKNGKPYSSINISNSGIIDENNRLLVPLRDISEFMNCEIDWNATEKSAYIKKDEITVKFIIGSTQYYINDESHYLDSPAQIYDGKTYIPFRSAGEALGIDIAYNPHTKNIVFSY